MLRGTFASALLILMVSSAFAQSSFVAHPCRHQPAQKLAEVLRPLLPPQSDAQVVVDSESNRLLISGSEDVQRIVQEFMRRADLPSSQMTVNSTMTMSPKSTAQIQPIAKNRSPQEASQSVFVAIERGRLESVQQGLMQIFGSQMRPSQVDDGVSWLLQTRNPQRSITLQFDLVRSGVKISSSPGLVQQAGRLVQKLAESPELDRRTQVFRIRRENHSSLRETVDAIRSDVNRSPVTPASGDQSRWMMPAGVWGTIRQVAFQNAQSTPQGNDPQASGQSNTDEADDVLRQFEGVEIESLPDLDVIILRGRDPDLQQLAEVISQLERISQETQPEIKIIPLTHASSESVASVILQTSQDLTSGRQGRVSVTPLVKPNALLLIGWGDAVNAIMELTRQLDTPVSADSQSAVFRIQHATAQTVGSTIETFLSGRGTMGPDVNIAVDQRTNSLIVYASPRDLQEVAKLVKDLDQPGGDSVLHTRVFPITNALAADIATLLQEAINEQSSNLALEVQDDGGKRLIQSGSLEQVSITPNVRNNTLIIASPIENFPLLEALIRQLDMPSSEVQLKIFQIVNGDAASMIQTLRSLLPSQVGTNSVPQLSSAEGESSLAPLRFSVDLRSNSIIATGSEGDLRIVEALLLRLDQATTQQRKSTVIQLKNAPAVDVAASINQYLMEQRQIENAVPGERNPFQEIEHEVIVVPEPIANKLILAATPRYYDEIKALIDKLDEQPPQVLIQVLIAEVALNNINEFGVELGVQSDVLFDRSLLGDLLTTTNSNQFSTPGGVTTVTEEIIQAATNVPGFLFNDTSPLGNSGSAKSLQSSGVVGGQGISNFAVGRESSEAGFGGLVLSASSSNVSVLLRALAETRQVRVLSRPQIRTLDNQPAFIQVGQRVPRIIGSTVNQNGQSNSITLENVGLILGVTPRVSPDDMVVMEIDAERSKLGEEADGVPVAVGAEGTVIRSPPIDTITAQATVSAANGETIILGGLISEDKQSIRRRVPYLSDIPVLKHLFKFDSDRWFRSELLVILTPHVIRSSDDNERLKQAEFARMSWCECDVYRVHGDIHMSGLQYSDVLDSAQPPTVYPDLNPSGSLEDAIISESVISDSAISGTAIPESGSQFQDAVLQTPDLQPVNVAPMDPDTFRLDPADAGELPEPNYEVLP
ncbi:secretin N-terminal domain-containing protein [Crateriforma conspicua]|uniref:secretin N-terminal domain-containing protein n=1 Tax=Crateriforma conspicua TaxID=2527996 RepID=UPI00118BF506|nr:secretin N-terminal domain-containing protein [Crateriforma conspicua]QDV64973.1 Putative type II secretion system protein D precursor [Crateriforma conspicua]